jgi:peptide/nickel transport system permease protein
VKQKVPLAIIVSGAILGLMVGGALLGRFLTPYDPAEPDLLLGQSTPSGAHLLGTDDLGRDVLSRVIAGTLTAVLPPAFIALTAMLIGSTFGLLAGYFGGKVDMFIMRGVDLLLALPGLLVAIVVIGIIGGGLWAAVGVLIFLAAPFDTRLIRGAVLAQRGLPYVEAARTLGISSRRIMSLHIWPNVLPVIVAYTFLSFATSLVALAALSFLGFGAPPGAADWGRMLSENRPLIIDNPAVALSPAVALILTAISANLVGDWLFERVSERGKE